MIIKKYDKVATDLIIEKLKIPFRDFYFCTNYELPIQLILRHNYDDLIIETDIQDEIYLERKTALCEDIKIRLDDFKNIIPNGRLALIIKCEYDSFKFQQDVNLKEIETD